MHASFALLYPLLRLAILCFLFAEGETYKKKKKREKIENKNGESDSTKRITRAGFLALNLRWLCE